MTSFGFSGMEGVDETTALQAPQATLLSTVAEGIFGGDMNWQLFGLGALIGVVIVIVDEIMGRVSRFNLAPLAVGMGMYLNITTTLVISLGALVGWIYNRWAQRQEKAEQSKRLGVLLATGMIVGDSLFGILNAGIIGATSNADALGIVPDSFAPVAKVVGVVVFVGLLAVSYRWVMKKSGESESASASEINDSSQSEA